MKKVILVTALMVSSVVSAKQSAVKQPVAPAVTTAPSTVSPILTTDLQVFVGQPAGGKTFAMFYINTAKSFSPAREMDTLTTSLAPLGITPCRVGADINFTGISCGSGLVSFGTNEMYTYGRPLNIDSIPMSLNKGVKQVFAANFSTPVGIIPSSASSVVHIKFNEPVVEFSINVDSGQKNAPSIDTLTFVAGPADAQTSVSHAMVAGAGQWVGVESVDGFTELTLVADGQLAGAFVADKFTVVIKADYIQ